MRVYSVMFGSATVPLSLPSLAIRRGAATSFAAGLGLTRSGRPVARFVEIIVFAILLALMALPAPARAQTFTISSVTASPATVQPGQTVTFSATISASQNASNYPVEFSLVFNGQNVTQKVFYPTFKADTISVQAYSWTVPAGTGAGTYSMEVAVFNPTWSSSARDEKRCTHYCGRYGRQRADNVSGASSVPGGQRHGPGRQGAHVNDRNLDGRNFLYLSVVRE